MDINEVKNFIETNADQEEVKNYIGGFVTSDRVENFLNGEEGKKILQPKLDGYATKAIKSHDEKFKANELPKLIDDEIKKRFPSKDIKDIEIEKLKSENEAMKNEATKKDLTNKALKVATEKELPVEILDYFIGADEETTTTNLAKLEATFSKAVNKVVEEKIAERLKDGSYTPPKGGDKGTLTMDDLSKMTPEEINRYWDKLKK